MEREHPHHDARRDDDSRDEERGDSREGSGAWADGTGAAGRGRPSCSREGGSAAAEGCSSTQPVDATSEGQERWRAGSWPRPAANQSDERTQRLGHAGATQPLTHEQKRLPAQRRGEFGGAGRWCGVEPLPRADGPLCRTAQTENAKKPLGRF